MRAHARTLSRYTPLLSWILTVISTSGSVSRSSFRDMIISPLSRLTLTGELSASGSTSSKAADWNLTGFRFITTDPIPASSDTLMNMGLSVCITDLDFRSGLLVFDFGFHFACWGFGGSVTGHCRGLISIDTHLLVRGGHPRSRANSLNFMGSSWPRIESTNRMSPVLGTA